MTEYKEGMRLRALKYPEFGEGTLVYFEIGYNMWALEFDNPPHDHYNWPVHSCNSHVMSGNGRFFFAGELDQWFETAGPKIRKLTGFAKFVLDKSL